MQSALILYAIYFGGHAFLMGSYHRSIKKCVRIHSLFLKLECLRRFLLPYAKCTLVDDSIIILCRRAGKKIAKVSDNWVVS